MDILDFGEQIYGALESHDLVGMERIINEVGPEAAFSVDFPHDFSGRRLMNYLSKYPKGLPGGKIHPEFLTLGLKYSPFVTMAERLSLLRLCDTVLEYEANVATGRSRGILRFIPSVNKARIAALRKSIVELATAEERILMVNQSTSEWGLQSRKNNQCSPNHSS